MKHGNRLLKPVVSIVICFIFVMVAGYSWLPTSAAPHALEYDFVVNGNITVDTTWSGNVHITGNTTVLSGVTLTINPGTKVYFQAYQGYREPEKRLSLVIQGELEAIGTPAAPIYFTSDAGENDTYLKTNGDWIQLAANGSPHVHLEYVVVEFALEGFNISDSTVEIHNSVFRWINKHGIQINRNSSITIDTSKVYADGWGGISNGQTSDLLITNSEFHHIPGAGSFTANESTTEIQQSFFHDNQTSVNIGNHANVDLFGIRFEDEGCGINYNGSDSNLHYDYSKFTFVDVISPICSAMSGIQENSDLLPPTGPIDIGFTPDITHDLGYVPGDPEDRYPYVYDSTDETRIVIDRIGSGSHPGGLAWDGVTLWTAEQNVVMVYNTTTGEVDSFTPDDGGTYGSPELFRGLAIDDEGYLWGIDGYQNKVYKIDPVNHDIEFSFPAPNATNGGVNGMVWDGARLCMLSQGGPTAIYCTDKAGFLLETIYLNNSAYSGLTLVNGFWLTGGDPVMNIFNQYGRKVGWIYAPASQIQGATWDGEYLWVAADTYHSWDDEKLFKVQILDDHHHQVFLPLTIKP